MKAAPEAQRRLLDVQASDTAIAQLQHKRRQLPEYAAIAAAQAERTSLGEQITAAKTRVYDLDREASKAESDLEPVRERKVRDETRVADGSITDPKQLRAMLEEIEHLERRISELEDAELELMERLEASQSELAELTERRAAGEVVLRSLMASRDAQLAELDAEIAGHLAERQGFAQGVSAELMALYAKVAERSGGTGAAELVHGRCTGCQLTLTAADLTRFKAADADEVLRCEECNRVLVR